MNEQAEYYLAVGDGLMIEGRFKEAERAFRAAQNCALNQGFNMDTVRLQAKIINALEAQVQMESIQSKGGKAKTPLKAEAARANGAKGGRPKKAKEATE